MGRNDHRNRNRKVQIANASRRNEMAADLGRRGIAAIKWVLFATIPARLASIAFLGSTPSGWFVTVPGALLLGLGLARLFHLRESKMLLTQYSISWDTFPRVCPQVLLLKRLCRNL